jgi:hypothetical protein
MAAVIAVLSFVGIVIGRIVVFLFAVGFITIIKDGVIKACAWIKAKFSKTKDDEKPKESNPPDGWEAV